MWKAFCVFVASAGPSNKHHVVVEYSLARFKRKGWLSTKEGDHEQPEEKGLEMNVVLIICLLHVCILYTMT